MKNSARILYRVITAIVLLALFVASPHVSTQSEASDDGLPYVEQADLAAVMKTRNVDLILDTLNKVKQMRYQQQILPYLLDLWNLRQDKYVDLPWDVISLDIVRLDIGNVLAQAGRNGSIKVDSGALHDFAHGLVRTTDVDVASKALWTLAIFDRSQDVVEIKSVALNAHGKLFNAAVVSLATMCNEGAAKALADLASANLTPDQHKYVIEATERFGKFKERTGSCSAKQRNWQ